MAKKLRDIVEDVKVTTHRLQKVDTAANNRWKRLSPMMKSHPHYEHEVTDFVNGSHLLNHYLLSGELPEHDEETEDEHLDHKDKLEAMDTYLSHAICRSKTPRQMYLYHGAGFDPSEFQKNDEGKHVIKNPAYLSTTTSFKEACEFSDGKSEGHSGVKGHILRIHVPKGTHSIIPPTSDYFANEKELILHKNHILHVDPKPIHIHNQNTGNKYKVWNARLVHDGVGNG